MFHDTFSDNKNELIPALIEGVQKAVKRLSPSSLHSTVRLLRECGEDDKANDLIEYYLQARSDENKIFNLVGGPFSSDFTDAIFIERFAAKYTESQITVPLLDAARHISGGPSRDDIAALTKASENDFIELFKLEHGTQHHSLVSSCVDLINWGDYKSIGETARAALIRIGRENHLNAMRVKRFGVDDDELNDNKPAAKQ
jgi:hypothetical protein